MAVNGKVARWQGVERGGPLCGSARKPGFWWLEACSLLQQDSREERQRRWKSIMPQLGITPSRASVGDVQRGIAGLFEDRAELLACV